MVSLRRLPVADEGQVSAWAGIPVGVAVQARRRAVGSPPCVGNSTVGVEDLGKVEIGLVDKLL